MSYWWVNQNSTYVEEVGGGFLWSPKMKADGHRNYFYDTMTRVQPGDIVFSFRNTLICAIGVVQSTAESSPKPFSHVPNWDDQGWRVEVEFDELVRPFRPKDFMNLISPHLAAKYAPLQAGGNGNQGVYLTDISEEFANVLFQLSGVSEADLLNDLLPEVDTELEAQLQEEIALRQLQGDVEAVQLVKARRGQGVFRHNVRVYEKRCRITKLDKIIHLRASHIKPWREASSSEKLDGENGLLLSPHVDHLFDRGFLSFTDSGGILIAKNLSLDVLQRWSLDQGANVGKFTSGQVDYLTYHRDLVFESALKAS